jgi:NitT/TauT family transport system substrate-binding protein
VLNTNDIMGGATTFTMLSTTARYREANPQTYAAVLAALEEANEFIRANPEQAAQILFAAEAGAGFTVEELTDVLRDPDIAFTTTPENTVKYAEFMQEIGSIENRPESWRDLFFAEIHGAPGS